MHLQERRAKNPLGITVCIFNVILMLCKKIIMINIKIYKQQGAEKHFFLFISVYWMHIKHVNDIFWRWGVGYGVKSSFLGLSYHMIWCLLRIFVFYVIL